MLRHTKLPVSFNSCITLSPGEMITVSSSISLHANAGFFCHTPLAATFMTAKPPRKTDSFGNTGGSRRFPGLLRSISATAVGGLSRLQRKIGRREAAPLGVQQGGVAQCGFRSLESGERFRPQVRWYSSHPP